MTVGDSCGHCRSPVPAHADRCPHCASPLTVPNVRAAQDPEEIQALDNRYGLALSTAVAPTQAALLDFESAVETRSQAVLTRSATEVLRLAASDQELYASFYDLVGAGVRSPSGGSWDRLREAVDSRLFNYYKEHIRFAALSLDGLGLMHYGDCFLVLKTEMIEHRSTVFEENSVVFMRRHGVGLTDEDLPKGYRATWKARGRLAIAKLATKVGSLTQPYDHPGILLHNGTASADDDFIEVHIYGPFSVRAIAGVHLHATPKTGFRIKALAHRLKALGIPFTRD